MNLPGLSGLEIARRLQGKRPPVRLIMLTIHKEEDIFNRALDFGAKGFVLENASRKLSKPSRGRRRRTLFELPISGYLVRRRGRAERSPPGNPASTTSPRPNAAFSSSLPRIKPAARSGPNCSSARAPSRRIAPTSAPSWNYAAATACCNSPSKTVRPSDRCGRCYKCSCTLAPPLQLFSYVFPPRKIGVTYLVQNSE